MWFGVLDNSTLTESPKVFLLLGSTPDLLSDSLHGLHRRTLHLRGEGVSVFEGLHHPWGESLSGDRLFWSSGFCGVLVCGVTGYDCFFSLSICVLMWISFALPSINKSFILSSFAVVWEWVLWTENCFLAVVDWMEADQNVSLQIIRKVWYIYVD